MEAHEHRAALETLQHALTAGERGEAIWLSLAGAAAASGDPRGARAHLALGRSVLPASAGIPAALDRSRELGPAPAPGDLARTICPQGPAPLIRAYTRGSVLSPIFAWWGRRHPEASGYATRQEWVSRRPDDAQAQRLWGLALLRNRREIEAGMALRRAVALAPDSPAARLALADFLAGSGWITAAGREYIECLKRRPNWLPALMGLGWTSLRDDLRYGLDSFARATKIAPENADAWIGLGRAYSQQNGRNDREALEAFQAAARLAPDRTDFYTYYADALGRGGRWDEAERLLRRRLAAAPGDAECRYLLATALMDHDPSPERDAEAEAQAREAIARAPHVGVAKGVLGQLLLRRGKVKEAVAALQGALGDDPYDVKAMNVLVRAYMRAGQAQRAIPLSRRSRLLFSDRQRINVLENQRKENFLDGKIHEELAALYARTGQERKALYARETARDLRADPRQVARSLQEFRASIQAALPRTEGRR